MWYIVSKCYDLYFGSLLDQDGAQSVRTMLSCSATHSGTRRPSESCVAYIKRGVLGARALGKKQVSLRHKRTKATQQDLSNHILLCSTNGIDYVPHS